MILLKKLFILTAILMLAQTSFGQTNICSTPLIDAVTEGNITKVSQILSSGAPIDQKGCKGTTALMTASKLGLPQILDLLLQNKASVNIIDDYGYTALIYAVTHLGDSVSITKILENGGDPNLSDLSNRTPLMFAIDLQNLPAVVTLANWKTTNLEQRNDSKFYYTCFRGCTALEIATTQFERIKTDLNGAYVIELIKAGAKFDDFILSWLGSAQTRAIPIFEEIRKLKPDTKFQAALANSADPTYVSYALKTLKVDINKNYLVNMGTFYEVEGMPLCEAINAGWNYQPTIPQIKALIELGSNPLLPCDGSDIYPPASVPYGKSTLGELSTSGAHYMSATNYLTFSEVLLENIPNGWISLDDSTKKFIQFGSISTFGKANDYEIYQDQNIVMLFKLYVKYGATAKDFTSLTHFESEHFSKTVEYLKSIGVTK